MSPRISDQSPTMHYITEQGTLFKVLLQNHDLKDREMYGFPKEKIVYDVSCFLNSIKRVVGRENKINGTRKMFAYLATPDCKKFLQTYNTFNNIVKKKLLEFHHKENIREAQRWWRDIYGTRIPIESL